MAPDGLAHRGAPHRPDPDRASCGTAARSPPPARPSWPTAVRRSPPTPPTSGRSRPAGAGRRWGPGLGAGPLHHGVARRPTGRPSGCARPALRQQPDRVTYLRTEVTPPAGTRRRATAYVSAAHTYRLFVDGDAGRRLAELLVPRRAVRARGGPDRRARPAGGAAPSACCTAGTGPGQGRPASSPGLLFQLSVWYGDGRHVVFGSDGTWRERPAEWLPSPQRNSDGGDFVEWVDGRAQPAGVVEPRLRRRRVVAGDRASARPAPRPSAAPTRSAPPSARRRSTRCACTPWRAARSWRTSAPSTPPRPQVAFARGQPGRTVTMRAGYLLDPDGQVSTLHGTQGTNLSSTYIMRAGSQAFEAFTYFGFRYLQIDNPGQPLGRERRSSAMARHAAMPGVADGDVLVGQPDAQRRLAAQRRARACTAATSSSSTRRPVRRASSSGTPPTSPKASCGPTATRT